MTQNLRVYSHKPKSHFKDKYLNGIAMISGFACRGKVSLFSFLICDTEQLQFLMTEWKDRVYMTLPEL